MLRTDLTSQPNTKLEKKVGKVPLSLPILIPATKIVAAAMLWAPFTEENNPNKVYRKGEQLQ